MDLIYIIKIMISHNSSGKGEGLENILTRLLSQNFLQGGEEGDQKKIQNTDDEDENEKYNNNEDEDAI